MTLETLLNEARALEISAKDIESSGNAANAVLPILSQVKKNCFTAVEFGHTAWKTGCPVRICKCNDCHKYGHYAKCCSQKSCETQDSKKGKQLLGCRNTKERKENGIN